MPKEFRPAEEWSAEIERLKAELSMAHSVIFELNETERRLRSEIRELRFERDAARKEICDSPNWCDLSPRRYAAFRGWNDLY